MRIAKLRKVKTPTRGTKGSAGIDFYVPDNYPADVGPINPGSAVFIPSGIQAEVPAGYALIAFNKSGVALKKGLTVGACVVDSDYQGEIHLHLVNTSTESVHVEAGEKLVQFLLIPVDHCGIEVVDKDALFQSESQRGSGGFGSTGVK